ncbi:MAG: alpha/beta hydrolase [Rhodospirillales bacterium RIFCSPLOWO2_12_FULL_58_28]|nr:MAG: alpha/beta hydrolase [Rhodospirillales bacterium RIFCSPLOWO2_02_FULL_58_16]OHC78981.1 MAG: alpha/beta hydrolase [Rhodospirillales bacterium RIFCSPLOWO2_12_FULL_58_28]
MSNKTRLLLLPGLLCDSLLWRHQVKALADIAETSVADLTRDDDIQAMARSVLAEAPAIFALAGLSMGGYLAMEIMRQAPHRVERLALLDTSPLADAAEQTERRRMFISMSDHGEFKGVTQRLLPMLIHKDRLEDKELCATIMQMADNIGKDAFKRQQMAIISRPDSRRDLERIQCKTLVLCGRQDALTPLALHQDMAAAIPHGALAVIEGAGHLSTLEQPAAVNVALREWLLS